MLKLSTSKTRRSALIGALVACAALAVVVAPAQAKRLGHIAPPLDCAHCPIPPANLTQQAVALHTAPGSPSYVVPRGHWKIKSWGVQGYPTYPAEARLLVLRRASAPGRYRLIARSRPGVVFPASTPTFKSAIRVRRGDRLGLASSGPLEMAYPTPSLKDKAASFGCEPVPGTAIGTGTACPLNPTSGMGFRLNLAARLKRAG
jgi:hypothetical protein